MRASLIFSMLLTGSLLTACDSKPDKPPTPTLNAAPAAEPAPAQPKKTEKHDGSPTQLGY